MDKKKQTLLNKLRKNAISGAAFGRAHSALMDTHIKTLTKDLSPSVAVIATGGYGREELCPASDIDLLFLTPESAKKETETNIEKILYQLWDSGIKIGHAVRTTDDCARVCKEDAKAFTTLLDARLICGDTALFTALQTTLKKLATKRFKQSYVKAKLKERDERHIRLGDTRYMLEPNIKDGKGSLRDYQTLFWIAETLYGAKTPADLQKLDIFTARERARFEKAHDFLLTVRCQLHDIAGRGEERLHFDIQPQIAQRLGYTHRDNVKAVERFMKHYFLVTRDIGDLTRILVAAIEQEQDQNAKLLPALVKKHKGFEIKNGRLNLKKSHSLKDNPIDIFKFFEIVQKDNLDFHPEALRAITRNLKSIDREFCKHKDANKIFLNILTAKQNAAATLRRMNEAGVLEHFIPEWRRILALMQFDRYHVFTVDEHTLRAVGTLHKFESGALKSEAPLACKLIKETQERRVLFVAMLLHDICKGRERKKIGEDHSTLGAELALKLCPRLGLDDHETRLVSWLIFDHLFMSEIAFKRDLGDAKTLDDFLFRVHNLERLKLLTILTTADIIAVGPDRWTDWKGKLLNDLYDLAHNRLSGKSARLNVGITIPEDWDQETPFIEITQDEERSATAIRIFTRDKSGLFATLSGALAAAGASIIEARIHTLDNGCIADTFTVQNLSGKPITQPHRHKDIEAKILEALEDKLDIPAAIKKHAQKPKDKDLVFDIPTGAEIDNKASASATCIEVYGRDRHALLYELAKILKKHKLEIRTAKINTLGLKAVDVFYVKTAKGKKLDTKQSKAVIKDLKSVISA